MKENKTNVIWVISDQQRSMLLSCNGDPNVHTPHIDNLANMGINFTQAVSVYPLCCPARGSILTGKYPHHCVAGHEYQLPSEMPTIANVFYEQGYYNCFLMLHKQKENSSTSARQRELQPPRHAVSNLEDLQLRNPRPFLNITSCGFMVKLQQPRLLDIWELTG